MPFTAIDPSAAVTISGGPYGAAVTGGQGKTFTQLKAILLRKLQNRDDVTDEQLGDWINAALQEMASQIEFEELRLELQFTTTVGEAMYTLPVGVSVLNEASLVDTSLPNGGYPLEKIDRPAYRRLPVLEEAPIKFFRQGNVLVLYPTPTDAYTVALGFRAQPQSLAEDDEQSPLGAGWDTALCALAESLARDDLGEKKESSIALNRYTTLVRSKISRVGQEREGEITTVTVPRTHHELRYGSDRRRRLDEQ